jgi:hypothetical protein
VLYVDIYSLSAVNVNAFCVWFETTMCQLYQIFLILRIAVFSWRDIVWSGWTVPTFLVNACLLISCKGKGNIYPSTGHEGSELKYSFFNLFNICPSTSHEGSELKYSFFNLFNIYPSTSHEGPGLKYSFFNLGARWGGLSTPLRGRFSILERDPVPHS